VSCAEHNRSAGALSVRLNSAAGLPALPEAVVAPEEEFVSCDAACVNGFIIIIIIIIKITQSGHSINAIGPASMVHLYS
jgi:hypothetical protein